jgi:hypothetical protein
MAREDADRLTLIAIAQAQANLPNEPTVAASKEVKPPAGAGDDPVLPTAPKLSLVPNQHPTSKIQHPSGKIQHPSTKIQHPSTKIQHPSDD